VDLLVVLNDNDMSISQNVGALSNYFARLLSGRMYAHLRAGGKKVLRKMPAAWELARRSEVHAKGMVLLARCSRRWASTTSGRSTATT
jgi:1-deoxy-D-xylulose-5-phosphate synthase